MKRKFLVPATLALAAAAALFGACKATDTAGNLSAATAASKPGAKPAAGGSASAGTVEVHADGIRRVNAAQLRQMVEGGNVLIYDTRTKASYDQEHIKGALSMPHEEVAGRVAEFPKDKTLVFYCTWPNEHTSAGAALTLKTKDITDTAALLGGMTAWKSAGGATEGSAVK